MTAALVREINAALRALPRPNTPAIRAVRRQFSTRLKDAPPDRVLALALALQNYSDVAQRFVGYELICHHPTAPSRIRAREVDRLGAGMNTWSQVDDCGTLVAGPAWREGRLSEQHIHRWARAKDRWWRRAALVSTVALNVQARGGRGDADRTLGVCALLLDDRDDMVVKAMSWALRALTERDAPAVRRFLGTHEASLAPRVLREVRNKLNTGLKNPRKRR